MNFAIPIIGLENYEVYSKLSLVCKNWKSLLVTEFIGSDLAREMRKPLFEIFENENKIDILKFSGRFKISSCIKDDLAECIDNNEFECFELLFKLYCGGNLCGFFIKEKIFELLFLVGRANGFEEVLDFFISKVKIVVPKTHEELIAVNTLKMRLGMF